ncbi:MAG: T9SS type A sorting domain-containing protein [Raineya sp.]|nr:T9SS type A sorting domain-containing protein [Raineya sp.]
MKKVAIISFFLFLSLFGACASQAIELTPPQTGKLFENHQLSISLPYPYPANENVTFQYQLFQNVEARLVFYDVVGNEIASYRLTAENNRLTIPTAHFKTGMYLYSLVIEGKNVATKKLLVSH